MRVNVSGNILKAASFLWLLLLVGVETPPSVKADPMSTAWTLGPFVRPAEGDPVIKPDPNATFLCPMRKEPVRWMFTHTFNPAAIVRNGKVYVLFRAEDQSGNHIGGYTSRLGLAESDDGIHFTVQPNPVLYPAEDDQKANEWPGGCEDPRIVETADGTYVLLYTQWNQKIARAAVATSRDLETWTKYGPAFEKAYSGKYANMYCKSAAIVTSLVHGRLIATKIDGKYWMYWGEGTVHLATSENLSDWTPVGDATGHLLPMLRTRDAMFDSTLAEGGPPPVLTKNGIVVLYNGKNSAHGDTDLKTGEYAGGQALFDASDPTKLLARLDKPFYQPEMPYERTGQYGAGTTFLEGLVAFKGKWFLYYGCADTFVAVATCPITL